MSTKNLMSHVINVAMWPIAIILIIIVNNTQYYDW